MITVVLTIVDEESAFVILALFAPIAQWIRHWVMKLEIIGSNPSRITTKDFMSHKIEVSVYMLLETYVYILLVTRTHRTQLYFSNKTKRIE